MKIDHIGYAVKDMEGAIRKFLFLGYRLCGKAVDDAERKVKIQFLLDSKDERVELVAPLEQNSPVDGWLEKNGNSPYHICYESEDMERDIAALKANGFIIVRRASPAPAMGGRQVAFLYSRETGPLELVERGTVS